MIRRPPISTLNDTPFPSTTLCLSVQLMLDRGQHEDGFQSWEILIEGGIAIAALCVAVVHLATARRPLFERALFGDRNLVAGMFFMLLIGAITLAPLALLPPMLQHLYG